MGELIGQVTESYTKDKYAMYLRKSRVDQELEAQGEGETLARHENILFSLAARMNITTDQITIYREMVSGDNIDDRPKMQQLLSDVYAGKYKGVLVVEVERLARGNTKDQGEVADAFQHSNTHIITPVKTYDPNNDSDQTYFEFGLFMSRMEYKTIKRRLVAGKLQSVKEGNYILPTPPYGFDIVRKGKKDRYLVERPDQSRIVKLIFDWYVNDRLPTYAIAKKLTEMGIPTAKNRKEWSRVSVKDILFNVHYIGKVPWGERKTTREKNPITGKMVKKYKMSDEFDIFPGKHDGFISEEIFWKVRDIYGKKAHNTVTTEIQNPFAGILRCADCGRMMSLNGYNGTARVPRIVHAAGFKCTKKSLPVTLIIDAICESLKAMINDCTIKMESNDDNSELKKHAAAIAAMESELTKQQSRKRKLMDSWESEDGMYTRDEFIERKNMYTQTIDKLKEQIEKAKKEVPQAVNYEEQIVKLHAIIDCLKNTDLSAAEKNYFLKSVIKVITYDVIDFGTNKGGKPVLEITFN